MARKRRKRWHSPGTPPGTLAVHVEADREPVRVALSRYDAAGLEERTLRPEEIASLSVPAGGVLWLNICGLSDPGVVRAVGERFGFHPLALEDVLNVPQRPKVERYEGHLLIILREVRYPEPPEQVSLFLGDRVVVSFQERPGDAFDPVRERLRQAKGQIRALGADFLAYVLCDAVIDAFFPTLEKLGDEVEELEERVIASPSPEAFHEIRQAKQRLLDVRRAVWPARDAMNELLREESPLILAATRPYLRDCYDHLVQLMDMVETFREMAAGLVEEYMSSMSNRMNEIMKVLTVIATIFIPLTFLVGVYGMNFNPQVSPYNMPELGWRYGYPTVLLIMAVIAAVMLQYFRRKKWL
ncbi:MAG: magnesium and cobalt transport protein CorA [Deltaproteobacteria bacterium RBG_16_64_85]|nr:MAG: magnesium and cobalt transport protein CorA [Deltaproteobacteria bacterium RBG_16_64_85]